MNLDNTGIRNEVIEEIRALARQYGVQKVILFGSRARGDFKRTSDIDLAVTGGDFTPFALDVDEKLWLRALQERNNVTHSYNQKIALGIVHGAKEEFYDMFCSLKQEIEQNWL